nr:MAG TPA: hypothetical protein [Caudoviricetes sp.]
MNATPKPGKSRNIPTPARESQNETPLDTSATTAHHARAAATSVASFSRLNQRRANRRETAFLCPKTAPDGVGAGEAYAPAGFVGRSANPRHHAAIWTSSQSAANINEVQS